MPVGAISEQHVRDRLARMIEQQRSGAISAKTITNARAALSGTLEDASRRDLLRATPASSSHRSRSSTASSTTSVSLRLIATSEALALTWPDIDLEGATVQIQRQQPRRGDHPRPP